MTAGLVQSYQMRHTNDPPIAPGRLLQDAVTSEILGFPGPHNRRYVYAAWADDFKYLQSWDALLLKNFLAEANLELEDKGRVWSPALGKSLMADYNCPVRIRRRALGYRDDADASE